MTWDTHAGPWYILTSGTSNTDQRTGYFRIAYFDLPSAMRWYIALLTTFLADQISFGEGLNLYIFMGGDRLSLNGNAGYFEFYCNATAGYPANHIGTIYF